MEKVGVTAANLVSRGLPRGSDRNLPSITADRLPADIAPIDMLSRMVTWRGTDGGIEIARPLTDGERRELARRVDELAPALLPFDRERPGDVDRVAASAADMYGSFPSMRGVDAVARIDSLMNSMARHGLPTWAIEQACRDIQDQGYQRADADGKTRTERQWAPSDSEVGVVAKGIVRLRGAAKTNAEALLGAKARA